MRDNGDQWPSELRLRENGRILSVRFESGDAYDLSAEYLRVMSPSAEVQGHRREERLIIGGKRHCSVTGIGASRHLCGAADLRRFALDRHLHLGLSP